MGFFDALLGGVQGQMKQVAPMQIAKILRDPDKDEDEKYEACRGVIKSCALKNDDLRDIDRQVRGSYGRDAERAWQRALKDFR